MVSNKRPHLLPPPPDGAIAGSIAGAATPSAAGAPLQVAWRRRWTIVLSVVLCVGAGFLYLMKATPEYTSTSRIYVEQPPRILGGDAQGMAIPQGDSYLHTQAERIKSTNILAAAIENTGAKRMKTFENVDNIANYLKRELNVRVGKQDDLISVSFDSPYRQEAARVVNGVVEAFVSSQAAKKKNSAGEILGILQTWKQQNDAELKQKMQELVEFKQTNGTLSFAGPEGKGNIVLERLAKLSEALTTAQLATFEAEARYKAAKEQLDDPVRRKGLVDAFQSQGLDKMDKEYGELLAEHRKAQTDLLSLRERGIIRSSFTDEAMARIDFVKSQIVEREKILAEGYVASLEQQRQAANSKEQDIRRAFAEQEKAALALNTKAADLVRLESEVKRAEELSDNLAKRIKEVGVDATADTSTLNISVEEVARPEDKPTSPNKPRTMALALVLGLMLGFAGAFAREWTDHRLRSADEVAATLGLPVLGVVPQMTGKYSILERGQSVRIQPMSETAEAYRTIRTAVFFAAPGEEMKTILVTSPAPGDGKTTSASNLAIALAQAGHRTLIIDADFRKPSQHKVFGIDATVGLSNVITGQIKLREAVRQTETAGLYVLPCGAIPPNPSEILNGKRFAQVMEVLCNAFDRIVLDSPPVMPVTDARILAASADLTILVLRADKSTERMSRHARDGLLSVGANILGVVVNGMSKKKREGYYGYGYGGYYGRGDAGMGGAPGAAELVDSDEDLPTRAIELRAEASRTRDD